MAQGDAAEQHAINRERREVGSAFGGVKKRSPILQAADIQAEKLEEAIPFFEPFLQLGTQGLEGFAQGATPQGLSEVIDQILNTNLFGGLVDERRDEVMSALGAGGLTRSGTAIEEAAAIPTDIAMMLEGIMSGRQSGLAEFGFGGASNIADLTTSVGEAIASGILGLEAQKTQRRASRDTNRSNMFGAVIGGLGSLFSDPELKTNVHEIKKVGPLTLVGWDWIPETEGTAVEIMPTVGFLSTEIKAHYPEFVTDYGGYDLIDYAGLFEELECHL